MFESIRQTIRNFASPSGMFSVVIAALLGVVVADGQMRPRPAGEVKSVASDASRQVLQDGSDWLSEGYWARKRENRLRQQHGYLSPETNPFDQASQDRRRGAAPSQSDSGLYRTVCVRLCDGYYFPISFSTTRDRFGEDEKVCRARCSGDVRLFYHSSNEPDAGTLKDLDGRDYADLDNAFVYRTRYQPACQCRPEPWSEAAREQHALYATEAWQENARREARRALQTASHDRRLNVVRLGGDAPHVGSNAIRESGAVGSFGRQRMSLGRTNEDRTRVTPSRVQRPRDQNWRRRVFNNFGD